MKLTAAKRKKVLKPEAKKSNPSPASKVKIDNKANKVMGHRTLSGLRK